MTDTFDMSGHLRDLNKLPIVPLEIQVAEQLAELMYAAFDLWEGLSSDREDGQQTKRRELLQSIGPIVKRSYDDLNDAMKMLTD